MTDDKETSVERIIRLEQELDAQPQVDEDKRWEVAKLIYEELEGGKTQRALAEEIEKSAMHVNYMNQVWRVNLGVQELPDFNTAYQNVKTPKTQSNPTSPKATVDKHPDVVHDDVDNTSPEPTPFSLVSEVLNTVAKESLKLQTLAFKATPETKEDIRDAINEIISILTEQLKEL